MPVTITKMLNSEFNEGTELELAGLSTDEKPTEVQSFPVGINSLFLELDTGNFYYFNGTSWTQLGQAPEDDGGVQ